MRLFALARDGFHRAVLEANRATGAFFLVNFIGQQGTAFFRRALFMVDMRFILIPEVPDGGEDRIRSGLPQSAK